MTIDSSAKVNVGVAFTVIVGLIGATWTVCSKCNEVMTSCNDATAAIADLRQQFQDNKADQYTKSLATEVTLRNAILNPGTVYADPRDPTKTICVYSGKISHGTVEAPKE